MVIIDGKEGKQYDSIGSNIIFSPDSKDLIYWAKSGDKHLVVINEKEEKHIILSGQVLSFSPDGKHFAYVADNRPEMVC